MGGVEAHGPASPVLPERSAAANGAAQQHVQPGGSSSNANGQPR